ncbi:MarR family winged helix-turn-helix transcriptional regulator [Aquibium microcysteis]|uniref:MarR family winged helix-turn-helix transcriptional regulator n=1 Tax=Aquibium microcysteis TaxID=675281 RepID=UPI00165CEDD8|nr:MarR family winged helix-turn-helix transcriptional regulator [Aquibium microcysteis]
MATNVGNGPALGRLVSALEEFRQIAPKMEVNQMVIFLLIAQKRGIKMTELGSLTGLSRSSVSRNVLALSKEAYTDSRRSNPDGLDLVTTLTDPFDSRSKIVALTAKGTEIARRVVAKLTPPDQ